MIFVYIIQKDLSCQWSALFKKFNLLGPLKSSLLFNTLSPVPFYQTNNEPLEEQNPYLA
jgi:hypothetical protein